MRTGVFLFDIVNSMTYLHLIILIVGLAALPLGYIMLNFIADVWEAVFKRPFWIRRYFVPFLAVSGILHIMQFAIIPLIQSL